jgi:hypothetical protein
MRLAPSFSTSLLQKPEMSGKRRALMRLSSAMRKK